MFCTAFPSQTVTHNMMTDRDRKKLAVIMIAPIVIASDRCDQQHLSFQILAIQLDLGGGK